MGSAGWDRHSPARGAAPGSRRSGMGVWIAACTVAVVVSGMGYSLWWPAVVRHASFYWLAPGDIWGTVREAHWVSSGALSYLYSSGYHLVTFPGMAIVLTPFVVVGTQLHLSESFPHVLPILKPTEWLLLGPVTMACSAIALVGFDALARALGINSSRRRVLCLLESAAFWQVTVIWGHPEDVIAAGLCAFALARTIEQRDVSAGWLFGAALAFQPLVIAAVPILLAFVGLRRAPSLLVRMSILPGVLLVATVVPNPHATLHVLLTQPNFPTIDHPTPWVLVAPRIARGVVAAGPGRIVGLAAAAALALPAARCRAHPTAIVWLVTVALGFRCLFESVMDPYYVAPAIGFALVSAMSRRWQWIAAAVIASASLTVVCQLRLGIWPYWLQMVAAFAVLYGAACPFWGRVRVAPPTDKSPLGESVPPGERSDPVGSVPEYLTVAATGHAHGGRLRD